MGKTAYNTCVGDGLRGKQLDKEARKREFCIVSKLCSSKAKTREEANEMCENAPPKEPKVRRKKKDQGDVTCEVQLAQCLAGTPAPAKVARPLSYKRFMSRCIKEKGDGETEFKDSQPVIKECQADWNESRGS